MERVAEPLLAGIYAGELRKLSLQATFPQFREAEQAWKSDPRHESQQTKATAAAPSNNANLPASCKK